MNKKIINSEPIEPPQQTPFGNSLKLAKSTDGLYFEKIEKTVVKRGGVPCMVSDYNRGCIILIFQNHSFEKKEEFDKIAASFSYDEGETWTELQVIKIKGLPNGTIHEWDPALTLLDNRSYRMYFTCVLQGFQGFESNGPVNTHLLSAISNDCINFKVEDGVRVLVEGEHVNDPTVIKIGDTWHYYSPVLKGTSINVSNIKKAINYHFVSKDGLNFERLDDITLDMKMLGGACKVEDGYRFYADRSAFSPDGFNWIQEDVRMPGPDPGIVQLKNGTYLMLYTAIGQFK